MSSPPESKHTPLPTRTAVASAFDPRAFLDPRCSPIRKAGGRALPALTPRTPPIFSRSISRLPRERIETPAAPPAVRASRAKSSGPRSWFAPVCFAILVGTATGQEDQAVAPLPPKPHVEAGQEADAQQPEDAPVGAEKMKKASAGIAAIAAIAILGIGVIAFTMIWARRVRRLARDPGPAQTTLGNDFWFLKPPKVITK